MVMPSEKTQFLFWTCLNSSFSFLDGNLDLGLTKCNVTRAHGSGCSFAFWSSLCSRDSAAKNTLLNYQLVQNERLRQSSCLPPSYLRQPLRPPRCHFAKLSPLEGGREARTGGLPESLCCCGVISPGHAIRTPDSLCSSWKFGLKSERMFLL